MILVFRRINRLCERTEDWEYFFVAFEQEREMGIDTVKKQHIQWVNDILPLHKWLQTQDNLLRLCLSLVEFVSIQEEYISLSFLLLKLFCNLLLQTVWILFCAFLTHNCIYCSLWLLEALLILYLWSVCGWLIDLNHFSWMTAYHVWEVIFSLLSEIVLLLIRVEILKVEVF